MTFRFATTADCPQLAEMNYQLIRDEGHRNPMTVAELETRMRAWLNGVYQAVFFMDPTEVLGYALYGEQEGEIYLRHLFVVRHRRRQGIGRRAMEILRGDIWPKHKRLTVAVLVHNEAAVAFWRTCGYRDYCLTLEIAPE